MSERRRRQRLLWLGVVFVCLNGAIAWVIVWSLTTLSLDDAHSGLLGADSLLASYDLSVDLDMPLAVGPSCDEDNEVQQGRGAPVDRSMPEEIVQFERQLSWGCGHREYHETRLLKTMPNTL